jgi:AcrR family transcriptional regulator
VHDNLSDPQRLLPLVAAAFADLGYRQATTAQLAKRCGVRENILYRAWPSKKAMFLAAIDYVFDSSLSRWKALLARRQESGPAAQRVLDFESTHHGEFGLYRIVFSGLSETTDPEIRAALRRMYLRFHAFIVDQIQAAQASAPPAESALAAWAFVGLGTVSNISRELRLFSAEERAQLFQQMGRLLLPTPTD